MTRLETQLLLLLAVATAVAAAAAASELLHHDSAIGGQLSDFEHEDGVRFLHKRSPAKKKKGFFAGFATAKKGFAKSSKGFGKGTKFGGGKKAAKGFGGLSSGLIRTGNDDGSGGTLSGLISNLPGASFDGSAIGGRGFRFGGGGFGGGDGDDDDG